jgi:hypothetical protein
MVAPKSFWVFPVLLALLSACGSEQIYRNIQEDRRNECRKLVNPAEREECLSRHDKGYDEYEHERRQVVEKTSPD